MTANFALKAAIKELAPTGAVRAAINTGNPVLARRGLDGSAPTGLSVDIAVELGRRIRRPVRLLPFDTARKVFGAMERGERDIAFLAIEPARAETIAFTAPTCPSKRRTLCALVRRTLAWPRSTAKACTSRRSRTRRTTSF